MQPFGMTRSGLLHGQIVNAVPAADLLRRLDADVGARVVVVAPAGWGKTTLLSAWSAARSGIVVRVGLEPAHADAGLLVHAIALALGEADPERSALFDAIASENRPHTDRARSLAASLSGRSGAAVVIDDAHLAGQGESAGTLEHFVAAIPVDVRLAIGARELPAFITARDVLHGRIIEIGRHHLALDAEAIRVVFAGMQCAADDAFIALVLERTEGWPAGVRALRLMAEHTGGPGEADSSPEVAARLHDYFAREVLAHLGEAERDTVAELSVLDVITPAGSRAVTRRSGAWRMMRKLEQRGWFIASASGSGSSRDGLRLHALLRDDLLAMLRERKPRHAITLHMRAARWHERVGRLERAVDHALEAVETAVACGYERSRLAARAATLLEDAAGSLSMRGSRVWLTDRIGRIPAEVLRTRPFLERLAAWHNREMSTDAVAGPIADDAPRASEARCLDAALRVLRSLGSGDASTLVRDALESHAHMPGEDAFLRSVVVSVLQVAYRFSGDPVTARTAIVETTALRLHETPAVSAQARAMLGLLHMMQGRLFAAKQALEDARDFASAKVGGGAPQTAFALQFLGYVDFEQGHIEAARANLETAIRIALPLDHRGILTGAWRVLAFVRLATGDINGARAALRLLEQRVDGPDASPRNREWMDGVRAAFAVAAGSADGLAAWLTRWRYDPRSLAAAPLPSLHARMQELLTVSASLITLGRAREAIPLIRALGEAAAAGERGAFRVSTLVHEAAAMESQGEVMTAESAMIGALRLAEPEWMVRIVADAPAPARNVLGRVAPADVTPAFLEAVRSAAGITGNRSAALTGRERDVLERLARGLSNKAIAHQLGVSVATVKTHLIHIFRKLGAGSRTQAITSASARGLIRPLH